MLSTVLGAYNIILILSMILQENHFYHSLLLRKLRPKELAVLIHGLFKIFPKLRVPTIPGGVKFFGYLVLMHASCVSQPLDTIIRTEIQERGLK